MLDTTPLLLGCSGNHSGKCAVESSQSHDLSLLSLCYHGAVQPCTTALCLQGKTFSQCQVLFHHSILYYATSLYHIRLYFIILCYIIVHYILCLALRGLKEVLNRRGLKPDSIRSQKDHINISTLHLDSKAHHKGNTRNHEFL